MHLKVASQSKLKRLIGTRLVTFTNYKYYLYNRFLLFKLIYLIF